MKDRLKELILFAQKLNPSNNNETNDDANFYDAKNLVMPKIIEVFLHDVYNIQQRINLLNSLIKELNLTHNCDLAATDINSTKLQQTCEQLISTIHENSSFIYLDIKEIEKIDQDEGGNLLYKKIRQSNISVLVANFQEAIMEFNKTQMDHRDRNKAKLKRQLELCGSCVSLQNIEEMIDNGFQNAFHSNQLILQFKGDSEALELAEQKHKEILKLEKSILFCVFIIVFKASCFDLYKWSFLVIKDLHDLFQEVAIMMEMQGDLADNIEKHLKLTSETVKDFIHIKYATKYKRRGLLALCFPCITF